MSEFKQTTEEKVIVPLVYKAITTVQAELAKEGVSKSRSNQQQGYKFRGIDDIYNALSSIMAGAGLCILPTVLEREVSERQTKSGSTLFYVTVKVDFHFVCAADGSSHVVTTYGEAMDSADKATNKAMSAAYKYACLQAFCIPTEGDNDADAVTHQVLPKVVQPDPEFASLLRSADSLDLLQDLWKSGTEEQRRSCASIKDEMKAKLGG